MSLRQVSEIKGYTPAQLCKGVSWYIYFSVWNPESEKMKRIRIRLDHIKKNRLRYTNELMIKINNHYCLIK